LLAYRESGVLVFRDIARGVQDSDMSAAESKEQQNEYFI
jgi:hypothetical protein